MNKYQEALDRVRNSCDQRLVPNSLYILQEAIIKADKYNELMKPKKMESIEFDGLRTYGNCPNCGSFHIKDGSTHCCHCGQALDWEKEGK